ncbi:protein of unknown function [Cupriavidus taiwanensis]|uniref:Uncharacterized protein n=1 Tax=Cupriavidus taiwanensis TaxID=164546 RepID=A0A375IIB2_9BURK|nr:protein of unknown function [Cupriavidus taiwanensis]
MVAAASANQACGRCLSKRLLIPTQPKFS